MTESKENITLSESEKELDVIKRKRNALKQLIKLTSTFSRLHQGLSAIILMGSSDINIPEKVIKNFKKLDEKLTIHSTEQLKNTLVSSDIKINRDIKQIINISLKEENNLEIDMEKEGSVTANLLKNSFQSYANEFKKNAQTSIVLRITLKSRSIAVKPFNLSIPENFVRQQIKALDQKETDCKSKIKQDMDALDNDMHILIKRVDFPEEARQRLNKMRAELRENIDHFYKDGSIDSMPMINHSDATESDNTAEVLLAKKEVKPVYIETPPKISKTIKPHQKRSLISLLNEWLFTSSNIKWKDIDRYK